jgi:hypothetical protein
LRDLDPLGGIVLGENRWWVWLCSGLLGAGVPD